MALNLSAFEKKTATAKPLNTSAFKGKAAPSKLNLSAFGKGTALPKTPLPTSTPVKAPVATSTVPKAPTSENKTPMPELKPRRPFEPDPNAFAPGNFSIPDPEGYVSANGYGPSFRVEPGPLFNSKGEQVRQRPYLAKTDFKGTILPDRVAQKFDITKAQPLTREMLSNGRIPREASDAIRKSLAMGPDQQLDHTVPLQLGGSNDRSNLKPITENEKGVQPLVGLENELGWKALRGEISVEELQQQITAAKGEQLKEGAPSTSSGGLPPLPKLKLVNKADAAEVPGYVRETPPSTPTLSQGPGIKAPTLSGLKKFANLLLPKSLEFQPESVESQTIRNQQTAAEDLGLTPGTRVVNPLRGIPGQKDVLVRPEGGVEPLVKGLIEFPERIKNDLVDVRRGLQEISSGGANPALTERDKSGVRVPSFVDDAEAIYQTSIDRGFNEKQSTALAAVYGVAGAIVDLGSAADIAARGVLRATSFNPEADAALTRLGIEDFSQAAWERNTKLAAKHIVETGDVQAAKQLLTDTQIIADALYGDGISSARGIAKFAQNQAKKITAPLFGTVPKPYNIAGEAEQALPGKAIVGEPQPAVGLQMQPVEDVGRGAAEVPKPTNSSELLKEKYPKVDFSIHEDAADITLSKIVVPKEVRGEGIGTSAMEDLIKYADQNGKRILLTPSKDFGASSVSRLVDFYKRFGFVENKGRTRDFSTRESMIREPKAAPAVSMSETATLPDAPVNPEPQKYKSTYNVMDKDDAEYLARIFGDEQVKKFQEGDFSHWRGDGTKSYFEDVAHANLISETPKTQAEKLDGRVNPYELGSNVVYHGTSADNLQSITTSGFKKGSELPEDSFRGGGHGAVQDSISFSTDPRIASSFTGSSPRGALIEAKLKDGAKVVTVDGVDYAEDLDEFMKELKKQKVDAVYLPGEKEVVVINKKAIQGITRSKEFDVIDAKNQLKDFGKEEAAGKIEAPAAERTPRPAALRDVGLAPKKPKTIIKNESLLLKDRLRNQARGAKAGFKAGTETGVAKTTERFTEKIGKLQEKQADAVAGLKGDVRATENKYDLRIENIQRAQVLKSLRSKIMEGNVSRVKSEVIKYANENLPTEERGRLLALVRDAKNQRDLIKAFTRIDAQADRVALRGAIAELRKTADKALESSNISKDYVEKIKAVLDEYELSGHSKATIERLKATQDYLQQAGDSAELPKRVLDKLRILTRVPKDQLTLSQVRGLQSELDLLIRLGKTKWASKQALYDAEKQARTAQLMEATAPINSKQAPFTGIGQQPKKWVDRYIKMRNFLQKTKVGLTAMDYFADITGMGPMKDALDLSFGNYLTHNDEAMKEWGKLTEGMTQENFERIGAYAVSKQEGGMERLMNSGISEKQIKDLKLTPEEEAAYKYVRETFDAEFPAVKKYALDVYNRDVGQVNDYVSFMSDYEQMSDLEIYDRFGQRGEDISGVRTKTVEQGFTKQRAALSNSKLELNIDRIFQRHMDDVAYMLEMGREIKMYSEIVNSPALRGKLGDVGTLAWLQWLDLMARKGGAEAAKRIAALDILRKNISAGVLAFRLSSALVQFASFADTAGTIGTEWATKGAASIATSKEWRSFIMDNFPEIKKSVGDDIAFREFGDNLFERLAKVGLKPLEVLDVLMRSIAASGSYQKLAAQKGIPVDLSNPDKALIQQATKLMRHSQGSSFFKDQPLAITAGYGLSDNRSVNKTLLSFQSFMLNRWSNMLRQIWRLGIQEKDFSKAFMSFLWLILISAGLEEGIRRGGRLVTRKAATLFGAKDKGESQSFVEGAVGNVLGSVPLMGQIISALSYDSNPVPIIKSFEDGLSGSKQLVTGQSSSFPNPNISDAQKARNRLKGGIQAAGSFGSLLGVPGASQAAQFATQAIPDAKPKRDSLLPKLPKLPKLPTAALPKINK